MQLQNLPNFALDSSIVLALTKVVTIDVYYKKQNRDKLSYSER